MAFLPVSSSNNGLNEDEIKREGYLPMQSVKLIDNQSVTKVWFIYGSNFSKFFGNLEIQ